MAPWRACGGTGRLSASLVRAGGTALASAGLVLGSRSLDASWEQALQRWALPFLATVLLLPVVAYVVRKRVLPATWSAGSSPELARREAAARAGIRDLQRGVYNRVHTSDAEIRRLARGVLRAHGLQRTWRPEIHWVEAEGARVPELGLSRRAPFGPLRSWLVAHVHFGVLVGVVSLLHAPTPGWRSVDGAAVLLLYGVLATGVVGALAWRFLPPHLPSTESTRDELERLDRLLAAQSGLEPPARAALGAQRARLGRELARARAWDRRLHGWRYLHVPLAGAWIVLVVAHALGVSYF